MSTKFKTIITTAGAAKLAAATMPGGKKVNLTAMAVGDGGGALPEPNVGQVKLINEVWRHALNKISQDNKNKNYIVAELVIPPEVGGFWMRELGLYDDAGTLIAVANMAESYKPELAEGSGRAQACRMVIIVSSIASLELSIDATTVMATQDYVDDKLAEHEQSHRHPDGTLKEKGFVQLSSATDSTSESLAATPKAVKAAYDLASGKYTAQDASTAQKGLVKLSSATDSTSETLAATPKAVKVAYDLASEKYTAQDASTARKGLVKLSNEADSVSEELAATPKAVKIAMDNASARLSRDRNGSDIPNPSLFVQNIGLKPTVDKATNSVDKNGDTMTGGLTLVESDIVLKTSSSDSPQYTIINTTTGAAVSLDLIGRNFRFFGVPWGGGPVKQFTFNMETGDIIIPGTFRIGQTAFAGDGNVFGTAWGDGTGNGGWLYNWVTNYINNTKSWVNQNFVTGVKRGAQSSMVMDGGLVEAPSGCVLTGGNGNEGNQVGVALYRPLQVWRNGGWVTIGD